MKKFLLSVLIFVSGFSAFAQTGNTITISGQVTDFNDAINRLQSVSNP